MLIPYSTDAPIYHFPWMTIVLIVVNGITFAITAMGLHSDGWLLTYGRGLHPLEWIAYNFLHFGPFHLIGNMFFLWAFGIVVEGKLGWWKYLTLYLSIGIFGGILIQTAMLGYVNDDSVAFQKSDPAGQWLWSDHSLFAQEDDFDHDEPQLPAGKANAGNGILPSKLKPHEVDPDDEIEAADESLHVNQAGAGGASLIIYGLMAIVLVWAPRNEIHCVWIGFRTGTFEIEYLYFCGFYIVTEVLSAVFSVRGFEVSSEIGHATGAMVGFGLATLLVKQNWVDCENWDLFSVMTGKHEAALRVGDWQNDVIVRSTRKKDWVVALGENSSDDPVPTNIKQKKKTAKPKPKLIELDSFDDPFEPADEDPAGESPPRLETRGGSPPPPPLPPIPPLRGYGSRTAPTNRVRELIFAGEFQSALSEYGEHRAFDSGFQLPKDELRHLADGLFKAKATKNAAPLLEEYVRRFPDDADRQRVKLSILYVKFLQRPTAALKMLAKLDANSLPDDYRPIYRKVVREAQHMIAEGITDAQD